MLASRARRRVRAAGTPGHDLARRRAVVEAFLTASREGDFDALLDLLDPEVTARAGDFRVRGAAAVARQALAFAHRAWQARVDLVDGAPAILVIVRGRVVTTLTFAFAGDRVAAVTITDS
jgi:RNA polymerase sigma-70 factor (ECF subfamily)